MSTIVADPVALRHVDDDRGNRRRHRALRNSADPVTFRNHGHGS